MWNEKQMTNLLLVALFILLAGVEVFTQDGRLYYRCPKEFFRVENKCYYLSNERASWRDAHFKCQDMSKSTLAILDKKVQDRNLRYKLNRKKNASYERWIGGKYDSGRGVWVWGVSGKKIKYQAFSRMDNEENYYWQCVIMDPQLRNSVLKYRWGARSCLENKYFICEHALEEVLMVDTPSKNNTFVNSSEPSTLPATTTTSKPRIKRYSCPEKYFLVGNNCYHVSREKTSWREAHYKCGEMDNSNLVILDTEMLDKRLRNALKRRKRAIDESWIGGVYNWQRQIWIWGHTGCRIWYQDFLKNKTQINEINGGRGWYCIIMDPALGYRWAARGCYENKHYICERPARRLEFDETGKRGNIRPMKHRQRIDRSVCDHNNTL